MKSFITVPPARLHGWRPKSTGTQHLKSYRGEREDGPEWLDGRERAGFQKAPGRTIAKGVLMPDGQSIMWTWAVKSDGRDPVIRDAIELLGLKRASKGERVRAKRERPTLVGKVSLVDRSAELIAKRAKWLSEINRPSGRAKVTRRSDWSQVNLNYDA